jgi:hypothetical protein
MLWHKGNAVNKTIIQFAGPRQGIIEKGYETATPAINKPRNNNLSLEYKGISPSGPAPITPNKIPNPMQGKQSKNLRIITLRDNFFRKDFCGLSMRSLWNSKFRSFMAVVCGFYGRWRPPSNRSNEQSERFAKSIERGQ